MEVTLGSCSISRFAALGGAASVTIAFRDSCSRKCSRCISSAPAASPSHVTTSASALGSFFSVSGDLDFDCAVLDFLKCHQLPISRIVKMTTHFVVLFEPSFHRILVVEFNISYLSTGWGIMRDVNACNLSYVQSF